MVGVVVCDEVTVELGVVLGVVVVGLVVGVEVAEVVAVVVAEVVGEVCSQFEKVPSKKELVAWFSTFAIVLHPASAFNASPIVHATVSSTDPREYSVSTALITFCELLQLAESTSVSFPSTEAPQPISTAGFPALHADSISLMRAVWIAQSSSDGSMR